jgi:O-antigen/teichoic acid export membrane protein
MNYKIMKNLFFYGIYQVILPIMSLFIQNHITRIFAPGVLGMYAMTNTIVMFIVVFNIFELNKYGVKVISSSQGNKEKLSKDFSKIYKIQVSVGIVIIISYLLLINFFIQSELKQLFLIQTLFLLAASIDIFWFYAGIEKWSIFQLEIY